MKEPRKHYARYPFVRGNQALWKGDASEPGSQFRQVVITSNEWMMTQGPFQVYALEGIGNGTVEGKFSVEANPTVLFDGDLDGLQAAGEKFREIVKDCEKQGFRGVTLFDELEFQAKLRTSSSSRRE